MIQFPMSWVCMRASFKTSGFQLFFNKTSLKKSILHQDLGLYASISEIKVVKQILLLNYSVNLFYSIIILILAKANQLISEPIDGS